MTFRTILNQNEIQKPIKQIDYQSKICLIGSCFVENIGEKLSYYKLNHLINPHGILFNPKAIEKGEVILRKAVLENDWIILDEIGKLDIKGHLWSSIFTDLIKTPNKNWIICVRDIFVDEVIEHWQMQNVKVLQLVDDFVF